jgi:hypothetical protein
MNEYIYKFTGTNTTGEAFTTVANASKSYDCGVTGKCLGNPSKPIIFKGRVVTAFTGGTEGVTIDVITSDTATISTADQRAVAHFVSKGSVYSATAAQDGVIPVTDIDAVGDCIWAVIPPNIPCLRYLTIRVNPVNTALATGYIEFTMEDGAGEAGAGCVA